LKSSSTERRSRCAEHADAHAPAPSATPRAARAVVRAGERAGVDGIGGGRGYALASGLVLMAWAASVVSQLLPLAERHPERIAAWLSERAGRKVAFDRVETQWTRRGPLLRLDAMRVGDGPQPVLIGDAEMLIS